MLHAQLVALQWHASCVCCNELTYLCGSAAYRDGPDRRSALRSTRSAKAVLTRSLEVTSALRAHECKRVLRAEHVAMEVCNPLTSTGGNVQIADRFLKMR